MDCPQCGAQNYTQEHDTADHAPSCSLKLAQDKMNAEYAAEAEQVPTDAPESPAETPEPVPEPEAQPPAE